MMNAGRVLQRDEHAATGRRLEARGGPEMSIMPDAAVLTAGAYDQADETAGDRSIPVGASGRGVVSRDSLCLRTAG
jgi:hypothetical protein